MSWWLFTWFSAILRESVTYHLYTEVGLIIAKLCVDCWWPLDTIYGKCYKSHSVWILSVVNVIEHSPSWLLLCALGTVATVCTLMCVYSRGLIVRLLPGKRAALIATSSCITVISWIASLVYAYMEYRRSGC